MSKSLRNVLLALGLVALALVLALIIESKIVDRNVVHNARQLFLPLSPAGAFALEVWRRRQEALRSQVRCGLRSAALVLLAGALVLIGTAAAWAAWPNSAGLTARFTSAQGNLHLGALDVRLDAALLALTPLVWLGLRRLPSWPVQVAVAAPAAALLAYLAWDDFSIQPLRPIEELAPPPPQAEESNIVLRSFPEPGNRTAPWRESVQLSNASGGIDPTRFPDRWRVFVAANRDVIRADWQASTAARQWIIRLDEFAVIGDSTTAHFKPRLWHVREVAFIHCAYATLLAIEGRGDEALAVLQPMLAVARKLQPASRTIVRLATTRIAQRMCQHTAQLIIRTTQPGPAALHEIAAGLGPQFHAGAAYARSTLGDLHVFVVPELQAVQSGNVNGLGLLGRVLFLPRATINLAISKYTQLAAVLAEGRGEEFRSLHRAWFATSFKNPLGRLHLAYNVKANLGLLQQSWAFDDERRALLAEVQAKIGAAAANSKAAP